MYIRAKDTTALIATDHNERNKYRLERQRARDITALQQDVDMLKQRLAEINTAIESILKEK